jgi:hypothetical protein
MMKQLFNTATTTKRVLNLMALWALFLIPQALPADVTLTWDASTGTGLGGYKLYRGLASKSYTVTADVGNVTTFAVTGLTAGTYYFAVTAYDTARSETGFSNEVTVTVGGTDTTPPTISSVLSTGVSTSGATISWATNEASNTQVQYGTTTGYGSSTTLNTSLVTSHSQALSGLSPATVYHYRVRSSDAAGNVALSGDFTLTTAAAADTTPPTISSVLSSAVTTSGATISWTTNEASNTQVQYGTTTAYGSSTTLNTTLVASHSQALSGLAAATVYHYRVRSSDAAGNVALSGDFTFTTAAAADTTAPTISSVVSTGIANSSATVTWTTNEASDSQVDYGTTTAYGSTTTLNTARVTAHSVALSGLTAGTTYHFRVRSRDAAGNLATSGDYTFATSSGTDLLTGLVAAYAFNEGSGASAADSSGSGRPATLTETSWSTQGKNGSAVVFNGSAYATASAAGLPLMNGAKTLSCWVNLGAQTSAIKSILSMGDPANGGEIQLSYVNSRIAVTRTGGVSVVAFTAPQTGSWHHLAYVFDGATNWLYIDGVLLSSSTVALPAVTPAGFAMGRAVAGGQNYTGMLDDVRIYRRALSKAEISAAMTTPVPAGTPATDTTPPLISAVSAGSIGSSSATVVWTTNEAATTQVDYGKTTAYGSSTTLNTTLVTSHSVPLLGLSSATVYHYRVRSADQAGNASVSGDYSFTTSTGTSDTTPPLISAVSAGSITATSAAIAWTTNEAATTQVEYGLTTTYGASTALNTSLVTSHSATVSGLTAAKTYHYRVRSTDGSGNTAVSGDFTFTTAAAGGVDLITGLVAAYAFNEGSGSTAADASGSGRTATLTGASWTTQGKFGAAVKFNGSSGYGSASASGLPGTAEVKTIACWVNLTAPTSATKSILSFGDPSRSGVVQISYRANQIAVTKYADAYLVAFSAPPAASWHHLAYVFDGTTNWLYIDGVLLSSSTVTQPVVSPTGFVIGRSIAGGEYYGGLIDDVRIYRRALTATQIRALLTSPVSGAASAPAAIVEPQVSTLEQPVAPMESADGLELKSWQSGDSLNARLLDSTTGESLAEEVGENTEDGAYLQTSYQDGEVAVVNVDARTTPLEVKLWLESDQGERVPLLSAGDDGSLKLDPGARVSWMIDTPGEGWHIRARVLNPHTGNPY